MAGAIASIIALRTCSAVALTDDDANLETNDDLNLVLSPQALYFSLYGSLAPPCCDVFCGSDGV